VLLEVGLDLGCWGSAFAKLVAPARVEIRKRARIEKNRILRPILLELRLNSFLTSCSVLRCRDHMAATTLLRENREKLDERIIKLITIIRVSALLI